MAKGLNNVIFMVELMFIHHESRDGRIAGLCSEAVPGTPIAVHTALVRSCPLANVRRKPSEHSI